MRHGSVVIPAQAGIQGQNEDTPGGCRPPWQEEWTSKTPRLD